MYFEKEQRLIQLLFWGDLAKSKCPWSTRCHHVKLVNTSFALTRAPMSGLAGDLLLVAVGWIHVLLAPYTKVEESFNLHATHDFLMYGVGPRSLLNVSFSATLSSHVQLKLCDNLLHRDVPMFCGFKYDHNVFPGAIPRTFAGNVLLSSVTAPFIYVGITLGVITSKFDLQFAGMSS